MCGICGYTVPAGEPASEELLDRMTAQLVHRGPDEEGRFTADGVALGMRRLSIIDLAGGSQPIFNEDRSICAVQNGEIYNFRELRESLEGRGHRFATRSDTEVLVHLYEDHGPAFVEHLNGMFAIAIWDARQQRLLLVRDRLGVKPLYYAQLGNQFVFGSEIKCLLEHEGVSRRIDHQAVLAYFTLGYIPQPRSVYAAIRKLPPAGRAVIEKGRVAIDRYWELPQQVVASPSKDEASRQLRGLLTDAVRLRMISDVPLGAFLSGGVDSSIVVALMAQQSPRPVQTFFIDFDEARYSEREYARAVADRYATEHHEFVVRPAAVDVLDDIVRHFDEPFGDSSAIPTWYVSQLTREHVTVALAGDGGDESFGGYNRYRTILKRQNLGAARRLIAPLANAANTVLPRRLPGRRYLRSLGMRNPEYYAVGTQEHDARRLLTREFLAETESDVAAELALRRPLPWSSTDPLLPYAHFDLHWYLPDDILTKVDRMSMAHSLEVRGPFLDYRVVELAARMPVHWKIRGDQTKVILKETFASDLPQAVLAPRKRGFSIPLARWLRNELRPALDEVLHDGDLAASGILRIGEVQALAREHLHGVRDRSSQLWRVLFFARWWHMNRRADRARTWAASPRAAVPA